MNANPGAAPFQVNTATGAITTASALDYETDAIHDLVVKVTDQGSSPRSTTVKVSVSVSDVNEQAPVFTAMPTSLNLAEIVSVGSNVASIVATDADTDDVITYAFDSASAAFLVDSASGAIKVFAFFYCKNYSDY